MQTSTATGLRAAGFVLWGLTGLLLVLRLAATPAGHVRTDEIVWLACFLAFGVAFTWTAWREPAQRATARQLTSLTAQTVAALVMIRLVCSGQEGGLLVIVAAQLGWVLPLPRAVLWVAAQAVIMGVLLALGWSTTTTMMLMTTYLGFQVLALVSCFLTAREVTAHAALQDAHRDLRATRELLAQTSRLAERERISRDLHDTLGHHLTALSLTLEAASHMTSGPALTQVHRAQGVTRRLLTDVRTTVGTLRDDETVRLTDALAALLDAVAQPRIHLRVPSDLAIDDPLCAQTVLRCVQEIITNTIRHAQAANLWIDLVPSDGHLQLSARDDGRGVGAIHPGRGLTGMRERLDLIGGRLDLHSAPAEGFALRASIPLRSGTA